MLARMAEPRSAEQRKSHTLAKLTAHHADVWVATASPAGAAHLVPLSFAWDGEHIVIAAEATAVTTRNLLGARRARLALGGTRDVVMIDATLARSVRVGEEADGVGELYAGQADWDPRSAGGDFVFLLLRPDRIQAWREVNEIVGRTLMREGEWSV
jgi:Pyridoxamine 5'-phosphate oxidase